MEELKEEITEIRKQLKCLIEINARLTHELVLLKGGGIISNGTNVEVLGKNLDIKTEATPKPTGIQFIDEENIVFLKGKTYSYKDTIKSYGGKWNPEKRMWSINKENSLQLKESLIDAGVECN